MASTTLERLAYETALRALQDQEKELSELRSRTGTLLAAGSVTSSLLGAVALRRESLGTFDVLALLAFVFSTACCIYLLVPKGRLMYSLNGRVLYEALAEIAGDDAELCRRLAGYNRLMSTERHKMSNRERERPAPEPSPESGTSPRPKLPPVPPPPPGLGIPETEEWPGIFKLLTK